MKISNDTRNVLKNFSTINSGIRVKSGNTLETISNMKNILAVATIDESFPQDANGLRFPKLANGPSNQTANTQICVFPHECVNFGSDDFTLSYWAKFDTSSPYEYIFG